MIYLKYSLLVVCSLMADLLNFVVAPVAVLFASKEGWLPRWLRWFQTPDNSLDGDGGWKAENRPFMNESNGLKRWWNRTSWLYRNSMYGFAIDVLGARLDVEDVIEIEGNARVSNRPLLNGLVVRRVRRGGKLAYFQWYYVKAWSGTRCVRINLGWKLWGKQPSFQLVFSINPFMGYSA